MASFEKKPRTAAEKCFCRNYCTVRFFGTDCICPSIFDGTKEQRLDCLNNHCASCREEDCYVCEHGRRYYWTRRSSTAHSSKKCLLCRCFKTRDDDVFGSRSHQQEERRAAVNVTATTPQPRASTSSPRDMRRGTAAEIRQVPAVARWSGPRPRPVETSPDQEVSESAGMLHSEDACKGSHDSPFPRCPICNDNCSGLCSQSHLAGKSVGTEQPTAGTSAGKGQSPTSSFRKRRHSPTETSTVSTAVAAATNVSPVGQNPLATRPCRPSATSQDLVARGSSPGPGTVSVESTSVTVRKEWQRKVSIKERKCMIYHVLRANPYRQRTEDWEGLIDTIWVAATSGYVEDGVPMTQNLIRGLGEAIQVEAAIFHSSKSKFQYHYRLAGVIMDIREERDNESEDDATQS